MSGFTRLPIQWAIVLGGGITPEGRLPKSVTRRLDFVYTMYRRSKGERDSPQLRIICSGRHSFLYPPECRLTRTESEAMRQYLMDAGVMRRHIFIENESMDTVSNAYHVKTKFLIPRSIHTVTIVTSAFHMPRVQWIFGKVFGNRYTVHYASVPDIDTDITDDARRRQKIVLGKIRDFLGTMRDGDHAYLTYRLYRHAFYREPRPQWVREYVSFGGARRTT